MSAIEIAVTVLLIAASAFFVAVEFALVGARNYRLEEAAHRSTAARAALRSAKDISLLLAGSQLGITLCLLGLGAVTKPALDDALQGVFADWGLPAGAVGVTSFLVTLIVVTFVHLVVGEMAPKSWAVANPERSAIMLALPMRAFMVVTRPVLVLLNGLANRCLRAIGVEPVDELGGGRTSDDLRQLVDHSVETGDLEPERRDFLVAALGLETTEIRGLAHPASSIDAAADPAAVLARARATGHLRLIVEDGGVPIGYLHVRDALAKPPTTTARDLTRDVLRLRADVTAQAAVTEMRRRQTQIALVDDVVGGPAGAATAGPDVVLGVVTMSDLTGQLLPGRPEAGNAA